MQRRQTNSNFIRIKILEEEIRGNMELTAQTTLADRLSTLINHINYISFAELDFNRLAYGLRLATFFSIFQEVLHEAVLEGELEFELLREVKITTQDAHYVPDFYNQEEVWSPLKPEDIHDFRTSFQTAFVNLLAKEKVSETDLAVTHEWLLEEINDFKIAVERMRKLANQSKCCFAVLFNLQVTPQEICFRLIHNYLETITNKLHDSKLESGLEMGIAV